MNIYSNNVQYPLNDEELDKIDDVWEFIKLFSIIKPCLSDMRRTAINTVNNSYTIEQFETYEMIAEKLFWNLKCRLKDEEHNNNKHVEISLDDSAKDTINEYLANIKDRFYRSSINKIFFVDQNNTKIMARSFKTFSEDNRIMDIFFNRKMYEKIMLDKIQLNNVEPVDIYFPRDYLFPNLNPIRFDMCVNRRDRIKTLYYDKDAEKNWFRLIYKKNEIIRYNKRRYYVK